MYALLLAAAVTAAGTSEEAPSSQTLVFYNARAALRERKPAEVLSLWLLRNGLRQRGEQSALDEELRSVVWAALGELGLCQDGFPKDSVDGAGLWPLALHNFLVRSVAMGPPPEQPPPWEVFQAGRQQRLVSLHDVLSAEELRSVSFSRTGCLLPLQVAWLEAGQPPWLDLDDRLGAGLLMRRLLSLSLQTLARQKVTGTAVVQARLFDLDLALAELKARRARREGRELAQQARGAGASAQAAAEVQKKQAASWEKGSPQAALLRQSLEWPASEWLSLSPRRRLSLLAQARRVAEDPEALRRLILSVIDRLAAQRAGAEVEEWVGFLDGGLPAARAELTLGERGRRLLELEPQSGFRARAEVALHRGVAFLEAGALQEALRSFAYALRHAEESGQPEVTTSLSRRWLSYVLARFETTEEVVATLRALLPKHELNPVMEDLLWRAALRADRSSFHRAAENTRRGGALDARVALLKPLSEGRPGELASQLGELAQSEPHSALRFSRRYLEALEREESEVRQSNAPALKLVLRVLDSLLVPGGRKNAQAHAAEELIGRAQSVLDGLSELDLSPAGRARSVSPDRETYAGSIRLAPSDPLPWPFRLPEPEPPSAFAPLKLEPVEWRDGRGELVFGWRISE